MFDFTSRSRSSSAPTWDEALREFLLHKEATFASQTVRYYKVQLGGLIVANGLGKSQ